jgi:hypothetical protein
MGSTNNPVVAKRNSAGATLDRRRRTAAEMSVKIAEESSGFFDKLAVLNAGALTFSVTLLSRQTQPHWQLFILYAAWVLLLVALASCLLRNYANLGHRFFSVGSNRAESEVALIDADTEAVKALAGSLQYEDSVEPFDQVRELRINLENREAWQNEFERTKRRATFLWKVHQVTQWSAGLGMLLGFFLLIIFAILNTYGSNEPHAGSISPR